MVKEGEWDEKRKMNATIPFVVWVYVEWNIDFFWFQFNKNFSISKCIKVTFYYFLSSKNMGIEIHSYIFWTNTKGHFPIS